MDPGTGRGASRWSDAFEAGTAKIEDFKAWYASPEVNELDVKIFRYKYQHESGTGLQLINCYPAELLTQGELSRAVGLVW